MIQTEEKIVETLGKRITEFEDYLNGKMKDLEGMTLDSHAHASTTARIQAYQDAISIVRQQFSIEKTLRENNHRIACSNMLTFAEKNGDVEPIPIDQELIDTFTEEEQN